MHQSFILSPRKKNVSARAYESKQKYTTTPIGYEPVLSKMSQLMRVSGEELSRLNFPLH